MSEDPTDQTLASYQAASERYAERTAASPSPLLDLLLAGLAPGALVLELGSGTGRDADLLEAGGLVVDRTDATPAFVEAMIDRGVQARLLDARSENYLAPDSPGYHAVFANAVLLHLSRDDLGRALAAAHRATVPGGLLVATLKKGDGQAWSRAKLDRPRHFTYWQEEPLAEKARAAGWSEVVAAETTAETSSERWITLTARRAG